MPLQNFINSAMAQPGGATPQQAAQAYQAGVQQGLTPADFSAMSGGKYSIDDVKATMGDLELQYGMEPFQKVNSGLAPALNTLQQGAADSEAEFLRWALASGAQTDKGISSLDPYMEPGQKANDLQAAMSGALGPEAQSQAYADFQASPGQEFLQQQGERALLRNASATGGLGGGNVRQELVRYGQGLAQQDFQNAFGRLGDVATRGLSAGTTAAGLRGQQAGIQAQLGASAASLPMQRAMQQASFQQGTGRDLATAIGNNTSSLANLVNQQGAGTTDIIGNGAQNINQLIQLAQQGDASAMEQLGTTLANLGVQGASTYGAQPIIPGAQTNFLGQLGTVASGLGGLASNYPSGGGNQGYTNQQIINQQLY